MIRVTTMTTGEGMAFTHTSQPTTGTILACVCRIDPSNTHATFLSFALSAGTDKATLPESHASSERSSSELPLFGLGNMQVLKNENGIFRSPLDELFSCLLCECTCTIALLAAKPFEKTPYRTGIFLLCLTGRVFLLESRTGFRS